MSSISNTGGNALSAHEMFRNEHVQIAQSIQDGLKSYFPMVSESGRIQVSVEGVRVDQAQDKSSTPGYLTEARFNGLSHSLPILADVLVTVDGEVSDRKELRIGDYYPVAEGLGARLIKGNIYQNKYQIRRRPGVYPFRNTNGALIEFNTSHGRSFNLVVDFKKTGTPTIDVRITGGAPKTIRRGAYVFLRMMGSDEGTIQSIMGPLYRYNARRTERGQDVDGQPINVAEEIPGLIQKLIPKYALEKLLDGKTLGSLSAQGMMDLFVAYWESGEAFDRGVVKDTIGVASSKLSRQVMENAVRSLVKVDSGEEEPDHRFAEKYRKLHGIPTQIREGILMDKKLASSIKNKAQRALKNADKAGVKPGDVKAVDIFSGTQRALQDKIMKSFTQSELSTTTETNNILDIDTRSKEVTIKGPGGIQSSHAIQPDTVHLHPSRLGLTDFLKTQASAPGVTVPLANGATFSQNGEIQRLLYDRHTKKVRSVSSEESDKGGVGFPDDFTKKVISGKSTYAPKGTTVFATIGDQVKKVPESQVRYVLLDMSHAFSDTVNLIPFLNHNSGPRAIFGSNQMTQALSLRDAEAPLVRTLDEAGKSFGKRIGERYNITSKATGTVTEVTEESIIISEDGTGTRVPHSLLVNFPLNQGGFIDMKPLVKKGDSVKKGDLLSKSNYTDQKGELAIGRNLRTGYMTFKGLNYEDGIVMSESAAKKMASEHVDEFSLDIKEHVETGVNTYLGSIRGNSSGIPNRDTLDQDGVINMGAIVKEGDFLCAAISIPYLKNDPQINEAMEKMFGDLGMDKKDVSLIWHKPFDGEVIRVVKEPTRIRIFVRSVQDFKVGDKLSNYHGAKGIVSFILPDKEMPKTPEGDHLEIMIDQHGIPSRANPGQIFELAASRIAKKRGGTYDIRNFHDDNAAKVFRDMKKEGLEDKERLTLSDGSKTVEGVAWGYEYMGKLKHQLDKKFSVRSINDGYSLDKQPVGGASMDNLTVYAMIGHNARANLSEMTNLKGTENHDFWSDLANNKNPALPNQVPFAYKKFEEMMRGLGVNIQKRNGGVELSPLTDKDIMKDSSGEITETQRFDTHKVSGPNPFKKGLFDAKIVGEYGQNRNHIDLGEPMPNPLFVSATSALLKYGLPSDAKIRKANGKIQAIKNIAAKDVEQVFLGKQEIIIGEKSYKGGQGLKNALAIINTKDTEARLKEDLIAYMEPGKKFDPKEANKRHLALRYVANLNDKGIAPEEGFMISKIPVIPAVYRQPIIRKDWEMSVPGMNDLYASVIGEADFLKSQKADFAPRENIEDQRQKTYQAVGALFGAQGVRPIGGFTSTSIMSSLTNPKKLHASDEYGGSDTDTQSPKRGYLQKKVLKKGQELSGRSTIIPTGTVEVVGTDNLDVDQIGLPEEMAWKLYEPFVRRALTKEMGNAQKARIEFMDRTPRAARVMDRESQLRPALINRAPSWWQYNVMAMEPVIMWGKKGEEKSDDEKEKAIRIPNMIVGSYFGGDFDGDTVSVMIPATDKAVDEANKMKPSQHLFAPGSGQVMIMPDQSQLLGLYFLTRVDRVSPIQGAPAQAPTVRKLAEALEAGKIPQEMAGQRYTVQGEIWTPGWAMVDEAIRYVTGRKFGVESVFEEMNKDGNSFTRDDFAINKTRLKEFFVPALIRLYPKEYARIALRLARAGDISATKQGLSIGISDLKTPEALVQGAIRSAEKMTPVLAHQLATERGEKVTQAHKEEARTMLMSLGTSISIGNEKSSREVDSARTKIEKGLKGMNTENSFIRMMQIGSKGSSAQVGQILGANLNVNNVLKEVENEPIKGNFAKGLSGGEYFVAQHGALSGLRDRAVETSAPGYLGKKIIMSSQELIVTENDCGVKIGSMTPLLLEKGEINMKDLTGRFEAGTNKEFTSSYLTELKRKGLTEVEARSPMYCMAKIGVCAQCYGRKTTTGQMPEIGFNAGVVEGQGIVQTSASMTLKSFHTSGASDKSAPSFGRLEEIVELRSPKFKALLFQGDPGGTVTVTSVPSLVTSKNQERMISYRVNNTKEIKTISIRPGQELKKNLLNQPMIKVNETFNVGDPITKGDIDPMELEKLRGKTSHGGFLAKRDYIKDELHGIFEGIGANFSRRTSETAMASMGAFVVIRDPGSSDYYPNDKIKLGEVESYNKKALASGKKVIQYDRLLEPTRNIPRMGESWLPKLNFEKLKTSITTGAIMGHKTPVHGPNPISSYIMGDDFGAGEKEWEY